MHGLDRQPTVAPVGTDEIHPADGIVVTPHLAIHKTVHLLCWQAHILYICILSFRFICNAEKEFKQLMVAIIIIIVLRGGWNKTLSKFLNQLMVVKKKVHLLIVFRKFTNMGISW